MKNKKFINYCLFLTIILFSFIGLKFYYRNKLDKENIKINYNFSENYLYDANIKYNGNTEKLYCSIDNFNWFSINECNFKLSKGNYTLYIKNKYFNIKKEFEIKENILGNFSTSLDNIDTYYLALGGTKEVVFNFDYPIDFVSDVYWNVEDNDIVKIENNTLYGNMVGTTKVSATLKDSNAKTYTIVVTDLIIPPTYITTML